MGSKRLPGKHLLKLPNNKYCIQNLVDSILTNYRQSDIVLCTTDSIKENVLIECIASLYPDISIYRGDELNVLKRIRNCINFYKIKSFIRINGDNVLIPSGLIKSIELIHTTFKYDFTSNTHPVKSLPPGMTVQICETSFFYEYYNQNKDDAYCQEHVFSRVEEYTRNYSNIIFNQGLEFPLDDYALDTLEDFNKILNTWNL